MFIKNIYSFYFIEYNISIDDMQKAKSILEDKGYCFDDYFLESIEETAKYNKLQGRTIYLDEEL